ncbi:MAG: ABC transporter substrate-binding protein [candidate division KSB1 bacterium]|nr:ABC transporter substrate-binding protein [candidate division KSB1 bacterium]MDZ7385536.1 ABC transporter substrate-binding protein [candidate division KSB1 bacterium]MDZ7393207.1 ABC transporter substrate-binding protein [candidate division KSB1 bacterium]MDZ7414052.1 ABC transporter substrate-binding protein [candidate division KSB1 bacterium]
MLILLTACPSCTIKQADNGGGEWRWKHPPSYGRSLNPGRPHLIQVAAGEYRPGARPQAVGPPLRAFRQVADEYERLHPDVSIEFLTQLMLLGGSEGEWVRTQLLGGVAPEIVQLNTEAVWPDIEQNKGWWIALDPYLDMPNPYVPGNQHWRDLFINRPLTEAKRAPDKKLYCIVYDLVETGIFYNQDIFDSLSLVPPSTWQEFIQLQEKLAAAGYVPLLISPLMHHDWAQDLIFDQCYFELLDVIDYKKASPLEEEYYQGYLLPEELCWLMKKGWFAPDNPRFAEIWRLLRQWRTFWQKDLTNTDGVRLFVTQKAAMFWNASWFVRRLLLDPLVTFRWGVFYPPPISKAESPYCCGAEQCVIGGAGMQFHVTRRAVDDGELDLVVDFLMFLTTPENNARIVNEAGLFVPNIRGAPLPPMLTPFAEIIKRRYCTTKWNYSLGHRFTDHHQRMIHLFLEDGITLEGLMREMGRYFRETADRLIAENGWPEPEGLPTWSPEVEAQLLAARRRP